ncbi:MAG: hypothetical protein ABSC13_00520 [Dehalococcoidia bacterium]|jgi:hypothetical protein
MLRRLVLVLCVAFAALAPVTASADDGNQGGLALRLHGTYTLPPGESVGSVVVIRGDANIAGTVTGRLIVVNGNADIAGSVNGAVTIIRGTVTLEGGSHVDRVTIIRGTVNRQSGSVVDHGINRRGFRFFRGAFFWLLWLGLTLAAVIAGLAFAAVGGHQLSRAAMLLTGDLPASILGAVAVWIVLPVLSVFALLTVVGIPAGLALLLAVLPLLGLFGYVTAGTRLGAALLSLGGGARPVDHPYAATTLGVIVLQAVLLVPVVGWAIAFLAGIWGSGALAAAGWRAWRSPESAKEAAA